MKKHKRRKSEFTQCLCNSGRPYASCCEPLHFGHPATDAKALMRSRYTAYALNMSDYILGTWHPDTRPSSLAPNEPSIKWLGLTIINHEQLSATDETVAFIARYKVGGDRAERMHEISRFKKHSQRWFYVSGNHITD